MVSSQSWVIGLSWLRAMKWPTHMSVQCIFFQCNQTTLETAPGETWADKGDDSGMAEETELHPAGVEISFWTPKSRCISGPIWPPLPAPAVWRSSNCPKALPPYPSQHGNERRLGMVVILLAGVEWCFALRPSSPLCTCLFRCIRFFWLQDTNSGWGLV